MVFLTSGLVRRGGMFVYSRRVPHRLRPVIGTHEVKRTLGTSELSGEAKVAERPRGSRAWLIHRFRTRGVHKETTETSRRGHDGCTCGVGLHHRFGSRCGAYSSWSVRGTQERRDAAAGRPCRVRGAGRSPTFIGSREVTSSRLPDDPHPPNCLTVHPRGRAVHRSVPAKHVLRYALDGHLAVSWLDRLATRCADGLFHGA